MSKIQVGDKVKEEAITGTVLALHRDREGDEWAWVETDGEEDNCHGFLLEDLTRIEPDVPQPKLVTAKRRAHDFLHPPTVEKVDSRLHALEMDVATIRRYLEAVPCPTCGQVGDD